MRCACEQQRDPPTPHALDEASVTPPPLEAAVGSGMCCQHLHLLPAGRLCLLLFLLLLLLLLLLLECYAEARRPERVRI